MGFHAEKIKALGAGLLSESNHGLKTAITETNAILDRISRGLTEADQIDPQAYVEDELLPQVVQFMAVKIKEEYPDINDNQVGDYIVNGLKRVGQHLGSLKMKSRMASKKSAATARQIKRGL